MWDVVFFVLIGMLMCVMDARAEEAASWYSTKSCQKEGTSGTLTASGEKFDENALTCAMRSRDFGKYYRITNLDNGNR
jgi:rare lipoprotein A